MASHQKRSSGCSYNTHEAEIHRTAFTNLDFQVYRTNDEKRDSTKLGRSPQKDSDETSCVVKGVCGNKLHEYYKGTLIGNWNSPANSHSNEDLELKSSSESYECYSNHEPNTFAGYTCTVVERTPFSSPYDNTIQAKKCLSVKNQLTLWETFLEIRIQLQKCLVAANKMPQQGVVSEAQKFNSIDPRNILSSVLNKLLSLQKLLIYKYPETNDLIKMTRTTDNDTDFSVNSENIQNVLQNKDMACMERTFIRYEKQLAELFENYKKYSSRIIQTWNEKTRIGPVHIDTHSHSVLNQINSILSDKLALIKRTQCVNSNCDITGKQKISSTQSNNVEETCDTNIFVDDDFYHQLLRELIESKSFHVTNSAKLGKQRVHLENLRKQMKKKVDTKATKGRKIRYAVHNKLVNTMAPIEYACYADGTINEIYISVFGRNNT